MYVSVEFVIHDFYVEFPDEGAIDLEAGGEHEVLLSFQEMRADDRRTEDDAHTALCRATGRWVLREETRKSFEEIAKHWSIAESDSADTVLTPSFVNADGQRVYFVPQQMHYPDVSEFRHRAWRELFDSVHRGVELLRWRTGMKGRHNPVRLRGEHEAWSLDGNKWYPLALMVWDYGEDVTTVDITEDVKKELTDLLDSSMVEPLAHHFFREAWEQRRENPRSALVIGIAAAEVGVKSFFTDVAPDTRWVTNRMRRSPPLSDLVRCHLPKLLTSIGDATIWTLSDSANTTIHKGIQARNGIVHRGRPRSNRACVLQPDQLEDLLLFIQDLLWLLDYYRGMDWALCRIRPTSICEREPPIT